MCFSIIIYKMYIALSTSPSCSEISIQPYRTVFQQSINHVKKKKKTIFARICRNRYHVIRDQEFKI